MSDKIIALYVRTSTNKQEKGLESQKRALVDYCEKNKMSSYKIYEDEGVSGAKSNRPALDEMLVHVESNKISAVIVYSFSRMARSTIHLLNLLEKFQNNQTNFISITEQISGETPMGRAFFTVCAAMSQLERELIVERISSGIRNAKAKGKKLGRPKSRPSEIILSLRDKKYSYREIAKVIGMSHTAVAREIKAYERNQSNSS
jgi:site-specific DNA recombinase